MALWWAWVCGLLAWMKVRGASVLRVEMVVCASRCFLAADMTEGLINEMESDANGRIVPRKPKLSWSQEEYEIVIHGEQWLQEVHMCPQCRSKTHSRPVFSEPLSFLLILPLQSLHLITGYQATALRYSFQLSNHNTRAAQH